MRRWLRYLVIAVVLAGGGIGVYAWLRAGDTAGDGLKLVEVRTGAITEKAIAVGQIKPQVEYHLKSKISGLVKRCAVEVGDVVRAGDPMFDIAPDPTPSELVEAERAVEVAHSAFVRADADFSRISELAAQGIVSRGELDAARQSHDTARIELARAEDGLALVRQGRIEGRGKALESILRAPAAGVVLSRSVNPGDPVVPLTSYQEGTDLAVVADMRDLIFKGTVDEIDVGKLLTGIEARIKVGALPDQVVRGRLTRIAPQAHEKDGARLFDVEIELEEAEEIVLRAGYSATADLVIREKSGILVIPERLVTFEGNERTASVELPGSGPGDPPRKVPIEIGLSDGLQLEVVSGLSAGDKVIERPPREIGGFTS